MLKIFYRNFRKNFSNFFGIFILLVISFIVFIGFNNVSYLLKENYEEFRIISNQEDFSFKTIVELNDYQISKIESKYKVNIEENYQKRYILMEEEEVIQEHTIIKYDPTKEINKAYVVEGSMPDEDSEITISYLYALNNNLGVGDILIIDGVDYLISGLVYYPDYTTAIAKGNQIFADSKDYTPIYMYEKDYEKIDSKERISYDGKFLNPTFTKKERQKKYQIIKNDYSIDIPMLDSTKNIIYDENGNMKKISIPLIPVILDYSSNPQISAIEKGISTYKFIANIIGGFIILSSLIIIILFLRKILEKQRIEIGILKSIGYSKNKIQRIFIMYPLIIIVPSFIIAIIIAKILSVKLFDVIVRNLFVIPNFNEHIFSVKLLIISIILVIVMIIIIYFSSIKTITELKTINLLQNITNKKSILKFNLVEKVIKKTSFKIKFSTNSILRNWSQSIIIFITMLFSTIFIILISSLIGSFNMVLNLYEDTFTYDYEMYYYMPQEEHYVPPEEEFIQLKLNIIDINYINPTKQKNELEYNTPVFLTAIDPTLETITLNSSKGKDLKPLLDEGIVVSDILAKNYMLEVGDQIEFLVVDNGIEEIITLEVVGITTIPSYPFAYISKDYLIEILDLPSDYYTGIYGTGEKRDVDYTQAFSINTTMMNQTIKEALNSLKIFVSILGIFVILLSVLIILVMTGIIVSENKKNIVLLKLLGFNEKQVSELVLGPYMYIMFIALIMAIPLGYYISNILITKIEEGFIIATLPINFSIKQIILVIIIVLVVYYLGIYINKEKIKKISISESLHE